MVYTSYFDRYLVYKLRSQTNFELHKFVVFILKKTTGIPAYTALNSIIEIKIRWYYYYI